MTSEPSPASKELVRKKKPSAADVPEKYRSLIREINDPVVSDELNQYIAKNEVDNRTHKLKTLLAAWESQQDEERSLRKLFAAWILGGLLFQMLLVNVAFFLIGFGWIHVDKWVSTTFIIAVLGEIVGMANIVVKYLFPKQGGEALNLIEKL